MIYENIFSGAPWGSTNEFFCEEREREIMRICIPKERSLNRLISFWYLTENVIFSMKGILNFKKSEEGFK